MLKLGVIGCGMIAELGHLPAIAEVPGVQVYALFDRDSGRAHDLQKRFHVPHAYPTEEDFWNSNIDAAVICTPAPIHHRNVMAAARHGKPVLCEKPLGMNEPEMLEMKRMMARAKLPLYTGFNYRFSESARTIRQLVRDNAIGETRLLRLIYNWGLHGKWSWDEHGQRINSPLRTGRMEEGGPMVDFGVHQIDLARWWLQSQVRWQKGIGVWLDNYQAPDHMYLHMAHECGAHTMIEMSFSYNTTSREPRSHFMYELVGTDGVIRYNREEHSFELRNSHGTQHLPWHPEKSFTGLYHEFRDALRSGEPGDMPTADDGIIATHIAKQATEQAIGERDQPGKARVCSLKAAARPKSLRGRVPMDSMDPQRP